MVLVRSSAILIVPYLASQASLCVGGTQQRCCDAFLVPRSLHRQQALPRRRRLPSAFLTVGVAPSPESGSAAAIGSRGWTTFLNLQDDGNDGDDNGGIDAPSSPSSSRSRVGGTAGGGQPLTTSAPGWMEARLDGADWAEVRSDATLAACYVLARFLVYDVGTGPKQVPGWELDDWVRIVSTLSSAAVLAACWTVCGLLVTQSFEPPIGGDIGSGSGGEGGTRRPTDAVALTLVNVMVATPLWLTAEQVLRLGPPGWQHYPSDGAYAATALGLASVMVLAKSTATGWR